MERDLDDGVYDEYDEQAYAADVQVGAAVIDMMREYGGVSHISNFQRIMPEKTSVTRCLLDI